MTINNSTTCSNINELPKFVLVEIFKHLNSKNVCQDAPKINPYFHNLCYDSNSNSNMMRNTQTNKKYFQGIKDEKNGQINSSSSTTSSSSSSEKQLKIIEDDNNFCIYLNNIINLSSVCKLWAEQIVPISLCGIVKVSSRQQLTTVIKFMTQGIVQGGTKCTFSTIKFYTKADTLQSNECRLLLKGCSPVRSLLFESLSFNDIVNLGKYISTSTSLGELRIPCIFNKSMCSRGFFAFCDAIQENRSIQTLDLSSNPMSRECVQQLCGALSVNSTLTSLDISFNVIASNGTLVADMLKYNRSIQSLFLIGNDLDDDSVSAIADSLRNKNSTITEISLSENEFSDEVGAMLGNLFKQNPCIQSIDISCNQLSELTALAFSESLGSNKTLRSLNLSDCCLSDENGGDDEDQCVHSICGGGGTALGGGGIELFQSLQANKTLSQLVLWGCDLNSSQALKEELALLLRVNTSISSLSLGYNDLTSDDIEVIVKRGLWHNKTIKSLHLNNNHIDTKGGIVLAQLVAHNTTMTELSLFDNIVDNVGSIHFLIALISNHTILKLCLGSNRVCPNISSMFRPIVTYNQVVCPNFKQSWINSKIQYMFQRVQILVKYTTSQIQNDFSLIVEKLLSILSSHNILLADSTSTSTSTINQIENLNNNNNNNNTINQILTSTTTTLNNNNSQLEISKVTPTGDETSMSFCNNPIYNQNNNK